MGIPAEKENWVRHRGELPERRQQRTSGGVTLTGTVRPRWERGYKGSRVGEVWWWVCSYCVCVFREIEIKMISWRSERKYWKYKDKGYEIIVQESEWGNEREEYNYVANRLWSNSDVSIVTSLHLFPRLSLIQQLTLNYKIWFWWHT